MNARIVIVALFALLPLLASCTRDRGLGSTLVGSATAAETGEGAAVPEATDASSPVELATAAPQLPGMIVHKTATCGCCGSWVAHMRQAGFEVEVRDHDLDALNRIKLDLGIPYGKGSCHTAEVGGYFIEGHVPADDIKRLLAQAPSAKGLVLPGMPLGSPGMESPDGTSVPYTVEQVKPDGDTRPFASH